MDDSRGNDNDIDPILSIAFKILQETNGPEQYEVTDKKWHDRFTTGLEVLTTISIGFCVKDFLEAVKGNVEILTPFLIGLKVHDSDKYNDLLVVGI